MQRKDTHFRLTISLETRVVVALAHLGSGKFLQMVGEVYGIAKNTTSIIVQKFCEIVSRHLKPIAFMKLTTIRIQQMISKFEALHHIPYIIGTIDGNHILIIVPFTNLGSYHCRKGFYSCLLQGICDVECKFWDYDYGWVGSVHDWALFLKIDIGKCVVKGKFLLYKLIANATYPVWPWFWCPFKGGKNELSPKKVHWNFIQSSTRMAIERAFGMLKGTWRILPKRVDTPLRHVPNLITTCLSLHNLCIIHRDNFNMQWVKEAIREMEHMKEKVFGNLKETNVYCIVEQTIQDMKWLGNPKMYQEFGLSYELDP